MGTGAELLKSPDYSFQAFSAEESKLRAQYLRIESRTPDWAVSKARDDVVKKSALLLEVFLVGACTHEALEDHAPETAQLTEELLDAVSKRVQELTGLDLVAVAEEAVRILEPQLFAQPPIRLRLPAILLATRSLLEACPIDSIEGLAIQQQLEAYGHRCRVAYDGIQAFILRNDPREDARIRIVGQQYAEGLFSLSQVAQLLDLHAVDAVDLLEKRGFVRAPGVIELGDDDRTTRLAAIRAERMRRIGAPLQYSQEQVARDVVASERIEGVDVRRWITREIP